MQVAAPSKAPPSKKKEKPAPPLWAKVLRFSGFVALTLAGLEMAFGLAGVGEQEFLKPDRNVGYIGIPNKMVTWRAEGFSRTQFNSFGMPDRPRTLAKPPNTARIAVLGDSYVEALQVQHQNNFCALLENSLNNGSASKHFEVLNFGVSAYNLGQVYLLLKHYASQFQPDIVLVAIRPDSLFNLVPTSEPAQMLDARPTFYLDNGKLTRTDILIEKWARSPGGKTAKVLAPLRERSHLYSVFASSLHDFQTNLSELFKPKPVATVPTVAEHATAATAATARATNKQTATKFFWPLAEQVIAEIKKECDAHGSKLVILRLPSTSMSTNPLEEQLLAQTANHLHIPLILTDKDFQVPDGAKFFYSNHLSVEGHRVIAKKLDPYMRSTMGMPSSSNP